MPWRAERPLIDLQGQPLQSTRTVSSNTQKEKHSRKPAQKNKELLTKLTAKRKYTESGRQWWALQEEYRDVARVCRFGVRKTRAQVKLEPLRD